MTTRLREHMGIIVAAIVVVAAGTATAVALQHGKTHNVYGSFAVLKAHPASSWKHLAHQVSAVPRVGEALPAGSTPLAGTVSRSSGPLSLTGSTVVTLVADTDGIQVYSFVAPNGDLCTIGINPPGTTDWGGGGCSHAGDAEADGSIYERPALESNKNNTIVKIVPNGVKAVTFTIHGQNVSVPVVNNVATYSSTEPFTVSFTSPKSHEVVSDNIEATQGPASTADLPRPTRPLTK